MMEKPKSLSGLWRAYSSVRLAGSDLSHCLLLGRHGRHRHFLWMGRRPGLWLNCNTSLEMKPKRKIHTWMPEWWLMGTQWFMFRKRITNDIRLIRLRKPEPTRDGEAWWMTRLMWSAWRCGPRLMDGSARSGKLVGVKSCLVMGQFQFRQATKV